VAVAAAATVVSMLLLRVDTQEMLQSRALVALIYIGKAYGAALFNECIVQCSRMHILRGWFIDAHFCLFSSMDAHY